MCPDTSQHADEQERAVAQDLFPLVVAEFTALRGEILKRIEFAYQIVGITLVSAGTFVTIGLKSTSSTSILLLYPIFVLFLAASWVQSEITLLTAARYIRERLEPRCAAGLGWEAFLKQSPLRGRTSVHTFLTITSNVGIFLSTQLVALVLALFDFRATRINVALLAAASVAIALTGLLVWYFLRIRKDMRR